MRRTLTRFILFFAIASLLLAPLGAVQAAITPGNQSARLVLGQPNFTSFAPGLSSTTFNSPFGVAVDPVSGKVFVADHSNRRILRFASLQSVSNGAAAEAVLCQPNFTTSNNTAANCYAAALHVDSGGRLWAADFYNHRVLRFDNAATIASGTAPSGVLGQADFTTQTSGTAINKLYYPAGVFVDSSGTLWVGDSYNHRVLRFANAAGKSNGANADGVLGQANFTSNAFSTTQSGMAQPANVFVDSNGRLWVSDGSNCRILRFDNAAAKANGANADGVLGQANFTTATCSTATQSRLHSGSSIAVDNLTGTLYASDRNNHRIIGFYDAAGKSNGANADFVMGQPDFTSKDINGGRGGASPIASTFYYPRQVFFDQKQGTLWVADTSNNRVLMFGNSNTYRSQGTNDGWVLESDETSGKGGTLNKGASTFNVGDDAANKQYRAVLSFNTADLPDDADITKVTLRLKRKGVTGGGNPITTFGGFMVDIKTGNFGKASLQLADFSTKGNKTLGAFKPKLVSGWYSINLTAGRNQINKFGNTQIRLRFKTDDNNDFTANFLSLHSGNASSTSKPQLIVEFYTP